MNSVLVYDLYLIKNFGPKTNARDFIDKGFFLQKILQF